MLYLQMCVLSFLSTAEPPRPEPCPCPLFDGVCPDEFIDGPLEYLGVTKASVVHDGLERSWYTYDGSGGGTEEAPLTCVTILASCCIEHV